MQPLNHNRLETAFISPDCPMFSDLIKSLAADKRLSASRKRDMISGLKRVAEALGRSLSEMPADPTWLQPRLDKVAPAALGLTRKSWQNIVSNARAAMAHLGIVTKRWRRSQDLTPEWQELWRNVLASKDKTLPALCRFIHFLSGQGVAPTDVGDEHARAYLEAVTLNEISKSPETAYRAAVNNWNLAANRIASWPQNRLVLPSRQKKLILAEDVYPKSFLEDVNALIDQLAHPNPLDVSGPQRALRPATLKQYRRQIMRFAAELVHSGVAANTIDCVARLCDPAIAERGLRQMLSVRENNKNKFIAEISALLRNLARILDLDEETREALSNLAKRLRMPVQKGMTRKNRERLRVFLAPDILATFLNYPETLYAEANGVGRPKYRGLAREDAIAIAILLYCPVRVKNLAGIHLEHNLQRPGDGRVYLVLEDDETKTVRPIEFEIPADVVRMIDRHLAIRSPAMCPAGTPWLFPRRDGAGPIDAGQLSGRLKKRIRRDIGIEMNAQLFRHLAVLMWLEANPGSYEAARRLLGHSDVSQTINLYSGLETRSVMAAFSDLIASTKGKQP